jgi:hypothetical protein
LRLGELRLLDTPAGVLAYERVANDGDETFTVLINFTSQPVSVAVAGEIAVSSIASRRRERFDGTLAPDEAVVLRP